MDVACSSQALNEALSVSADQEVFGSASIHPDYKTLNTSKLQENNVVRMVIRCRLRIRGNLGSEVGKVAADHFPVAMR